MRTGGLIVSAGTTARRDGFDPLQKIGSLSVVQRLIMTFHLADVQPIVVLASESDRADLEKHAARAGVVFLPSPAPDGEMFDNVRAGLTHLSPLVDQVLVTPVDIPLFSVDTVKALIRSGAALASPACDGRVGHPLLVAADTVPGLLAYRGPEGLRGAVRECGAPRVLVEVPDPGVFVRSDQFEECDKILGTHNRGQWRPLMKLRIAKETAFLGPGSWQLLSLVETTGSVRLACRQIGISYSKAWKVLNNLEEQVGYHVLARQPGGKNGGETHLTDEGRLLLEQFERFERECTQAVNRIFERHYGATAYQAHQYRPSGEE